MADRRSFGKLTAVIDPPDLIEIQTKSYREFLQSDIPSTRRKRQGLQSVFKEVFPIESYDGRYALDFVKFELSEPRMSDLECLAEGQTFAAPLHVTFRLKDGEEVREESVYMGEIPLMTGDGGFVVNGAQRVVVSQLHRSPGICSEESQHPNGTTLFSVRLIPDRGSWLELQFDTSDMIWIYMDRRRRRRKFLASTFLRALGYGTDDELLELYYRFEKCSLKDTIDDSALVDRVFREDVVDVDSKTVLARKYDPVTREILNSIRDAGFSSLNLVDVSWDGGIFLGSVRADQTHSADEALKDIYHRLRPGDPATPSNARQLLKRLFFDPRRYDLGRVGRYKINQKLGLEGRGVEALRVLDKSDLVEAVRHLIQIRMGEIAVDDIDHLGSRRVRTVGELLENQCRVGLARTERLIRERMTLFDPSRGAMTPQKLVNSKSLSAIVQDFFGRSQLSQFMDQTNPLSELAHKRRLSALGPGGLSRERAGFEVRDVHSSHYGRICPIETPEGPNIGLISSLCIYAKVNDFGFIESPYRKVVNGRVTEEYDYLTADQEERFVIAQANAPLDANNRFARESVSVRYRAEFMEVPREKVDYMDVSPKQVVSIAAGMIPFLEHDDANRALMGANMMRQAVPLLRTERPFVATGLESLAAKDSRVTVHAEKPGKVAYASADRVVITADGKMPQTKAEKEAVQEYRFQKFRRTNAGTCFNQKPVVAVGQRIQKGEVLADGPATCAGEVSLGKNLLVAFMPWSGYNFEDAILISERVVREDIFTSIHVEEFEVGARDTKLGPEEITRDIPNVGEEALRNLGADGVIRRGAEVRPGDILVGKITPKSETELAPEERLLRAIFGEKAAEVRDTSLTVPSGTYGIVMDVKVTAHKDLKEKDLSPTERRKQLRQSKEEYKQRRQKLTEELTEALSNVLLGEKIPLDVVDAEAGEIIIPANRKITKTLLRKLAGRCDHVEIESSPIQIKIDEIIADFKPKFAELDLERDRMLDRIESGDDLDSGIIKQVRVYVTEKNRLAVGDKLAGRHGNKGVVAKIMPDCEMPFLPDGTPVDIVLNPLGVPSRMNLGQVYETHLGAACKLLGIYAATPVFDGISEKDVVGLLEKAGMPADGKTTLFDGRTGEPFDQRVVVGQIYIMKLHHLVSDKIHARAVGPYSLVTQQPLGGKAQYGGQRLGEMEVWALEAYGSAYALQELLTVKSDDVAGRTRIYESIVKGENTLEAGIPESFSVLIHELRGLCLNLQPRRANDAPVATL
ncbi:MAG: DNA-directed RNA polymerase subunit beta [Lentisphaerae bacterium RIFOXYC12_FULL_60_16]|nr:MAG: DNA-directed RNA polymerase subunit beta [Lentisphaerae bacterium RIFOXYC12_FULL_60_16]OGV71153.1 MAG: DNA-directed RNA polymerase subunit beta [Lentisphaerae bacterium RIFOXYA12_FULL_60_10]OGV77329.1 MAG: DNA-directed RNA polymerase subunit beta [Lentisphaerae bacterium RIFOXYB12_FULL_60_10]